MNEGHKLSFVTFSVIRQITEAPMARPPVMREAIWFYKFMKKSESLGKTQEL